MRLNFAHFGVPMSRRRWRPSTSTSKESCTCSLPNGQDVDWIHDIETGDLEFILFDGAKYDVGDTVEVGEETFDLPDLDPAILNAVTLPSGTSDYGTTQTLFDDTCKVLTSHGVADEAARAATHFAFASWFADSYRPAPGLVFTGPPAEASLLLQLLSLVVRRGVVLVE